MAKRLFVTLGITALLVAALGFVKFRQIQTAIAQSASFQPPPDAVTTIVAHEERWPSSLNAIGTVAPVQGVTVSADLPGIVDRIAFESGSTVKAGDVLVQLDTRQEQAQLAAAEAQRDLTRLNYERMQALIGDDAVSRAVLAQLGRRFDRAYAQYSSCSPSRTSFLTGLRPERTGVLSNAQPARAQLAGAVPLQEHFRAHGYFTARVGKVFHGPWEDEFRWDVAEHTPYQDAMRSGQSPAGRAQPSSSGQRSGTSASGAGSAWASSSLLVTRSAWPSWSRSASRELPICTSARESRDSTSSPARRSVSSSTRRRPHSSSASTPPPKRKVRRYSART